MAVSAALAWFWGVSFPTEGMSAMRYIAPLDHCVDVGAAPPALPATSALEGIDATKGCVGINLFPVTGRVQERGAEK